LWLEQLKAAGVVLVWSTVATAGLAWLLGLCTNGIRVNGDDETVGLDVSEHGEEGYILD
jgi:Amt family ammonium transporter